MYFAIQTTLSNQVQIGYSAHKWMGLFAPLDVLTRVNAYIGEDVCMTFDVQDDDRLTFNIRKLICLVFICTKK